MQIWEGPKLYCSSGLKRYRLPETATIEFAVGIEYATPRGKCAKEKKVYFFFYIKVYFCLKPTFHHMAEA